MDLISVIIPIYNIEKYLRKCIDSVLCQTYKNLEIILVDDGSKDGSGTICDEYKRKDSRIAVVHKENGGLSSARNAGLDYCHGDYVVFIDGDDFIEPQMMELLLNLIKRGDYSFSMILFRMVGETDGTNSPLVDIQAVRTKDLSQDDLVQRLLGLSSSFLTETQIVWNKLYPMDLLKQYRFVNTINEDVEYNSRIFLNTSKAVIGLATMYNYVQRPTSIIHKNLDASTVKNKLKNIHAVSTNFSQDKRYSAFGMDYLFKSIFNLRYMTRKSPYRKELKEVFAHYYRLTVKDYLSNDSLPLYRKAGFLLFYHCPFAYTLFRKIAEKRQGHHPN